MLEAFCKLLHGIASVDEGVETVLSPVAYHGLLELTESIYGKHAAEVVGNHFSQNGKRFFCPCEELEEAFRLCLTGKG